MPEANDPKPDTGKPDTAKPDETPADGDLARALDRIKSTQEDLARLDRLVSGMEHDSEGKPASRASAAVTAAATPATNALVPTGAPNTGVRDQGMKKDPAMMRALVILVLAVGLLGAAVASQYRDEAKSIGKSIMARWAPPAANEPSQASAVESPAQPPAVLLAAADEPAAVPAPPVAKEPVAKETNSAPKPGPAAQPGTAAPDPSSPDLAQSLKAITGELASINGKLEQLKSRNEQTLREQADTIQQLKAAQEKDAADNARLAAQVQALQSQQAASSAPAVPASSTPAAPASAASAAPASSAPASPKPVVRSVNNDAAARARPHVPAAEPRRPRPPPRRPWMPPPYDPYYGDDW